MSFASSSGSGSVGIGVVPGQVQDRVGKRAAVLAIHLAHPVEDPGHDPDVGLRFARRVGRLPVPLQPARRIDQRAVLLGEAGRRQLEHFGLDARRIGRILRPEILPEPRGLGVERIHRDEEFQLAQRLADLAPVRERLQRIEALADVAVHLAVRHHLEGFDDVVERNVEFRQPVVGPVVVGARGVAIDRLLEADEELAIVLPVARLARTQRLELPRLHVLFEGRLAVCRQRRDSRVSGSTAGRYRSAPECSNDRAGRSSRRPQRRYCPAAAGPSPWCGCSGSQPNAASSRARTGSSSPCRAPPCVANSSQTCRYLSCGVPQMRDTISGVYRSTCLRSKLMTQRGFCHVSSTLAKPCSSSS